MYYTSVMNAKLALHLVLVLSATLSLAPTLSFAQPPSDKSGRHSKMDRRARWGSLTEEERAKIRAAHQKAMADPAVKAARDKLKQARQEFREVMHPAMLKADPSIQPILDKLRAEKVATN